ncbi:MAG: 3-oxoacyl-ACP reductase FabG [Spirochaetes bacterium]|nr:3-oxoacyl-ACP reductase FabG [Spirochaetota bacterium]
MSVEGIVAVVTGAGRGLGKAIVQGFSDKGVIPVVVDINEETAASVCEEIRKQGTDALWIKADVSSCKDLENMVERVVRKYGTVDILVNNAGILHTTAIEDITETEWDRMMAINLKSVFFASQLVLPYMKKKGKGRIINISSLAGRMGGYANGVGYAASKAGIIGLTMSFARKVAPYNITVNAVAPGTTETEIIEAISEEQKQKLRELIPLGRLGKPKNIADIVTFLASYGADFITGAVIDVNGGMFMG